MEKMEVISDKPVYISDKAYFQSKANINLEKTDVKVILAEVIREIITRIDIFQNNGSGWYFKEVVNLEIHTVKYNPLGGSSYIPLPDWIMRKNAITNTRNTDEKCFLWSILRYLHPRQKNDIRLTDLKQYENDLNTQGIDFPVKVKDISKFESLKPTIPGINVFSVSENNKF